MTDDKSMNGKEIGSPITSKSTDNESYISDGDCIEKLRKKRKPKSPVSIRGSKQRKKDAKNEDVWEWWNEDTGSSGVKWTFLEHKGPVFAPPYERLPSNVKFYYDGEEINLSNESQEVAGFYAQLLGHNYTKKAVFNENFLYDWRTFMSDSEKSVIVDLKKCDFKDISSYYKELSEKRKTLSKEEKQVLVQEREKITSDFGFCIVDNHRQKIGNFKIEPPGLFRGRGDHPKMGCVKRRIYPEDVIINCSRDSRVPSPPVGHRWKEVRHDTSVGWLACWIDNVQQNYKYVLLNVASKMRGERDWRKFETARRLHLIIDGVRRDYLRDMQSKEMWVRQRAVALYFIDKLALRAGNEKGDEEADTVGCCSLRVEHVRLGEERVGSSTVYEVELDFLGKDSVRYENCFPVLKRVYKNVSRFIEGKHPEDSLFDRLNTSLLNQYLKELMPGLTAKVFRTYNASKILEEQLDRFTKPKHSIDNKVYAYNKANRAVAILCNHQKSIPKGFEKSMENLEIKIEEKKNKIEAIKKEARKIKKQYKRCRQPSIRNNYEKLGKKLLKHQEQLCRLKTNAEGKSENKELALGTSKLNYLDPRITVAWCMKNSVPIEKIYNKSQLQKFRWAVDVTVANFSFCDLKSDSSSSKLTELSGDSDQESDHEGNELSFVQQYF